MERVEIGNWWISEIVRVEDGQETDDNTWDSTGVEEHVQKFHIDVFEAAAETIEEDGCWNKNVILPIFSRSPQKQEKSISVMYSQNPERVMKPATMRTGCRLNCFWGSSDHAKPPPCWTAQ